MADGNQTLRRLRVALKKRLNNQLAVDGAGNRLAYAHILQNRIAQIEAEVLNLRSWHVFDPKIGCVANTGN